MRPFDPRILRVVPATRRPVAALAGIGVAQGIATIGTAFALAVLVVSVVRGQDLVAPMVWTGGLFAVRALLGAASEAIAARAGTVVATHLREQLIAAWSQRTIHQRPFEAPSSHLRTPPSRDRALTLATQGTSAVEPYVAKYLPALVSAAVVPPLAIACLLVVDWPSALVVILTVPLLPLFAALIGATTQEDTERRWDSLRDLSGHFLDVMRGLPTLVSYGRAERQVEVIGEVSQRHRRATMRTLRLAFMSAAALELLATISVAIVAVVVGLRLTTGSMDLLIGLTAILLAPEAYWPIRRVGTEFHSAADGAAALDEILADLDPHSPMAMQEDAHSPMAMQEDVHSPMAMQENVHSPMAMQGAKGGAPFGLPGTVSLAGVDYSYPGTERTVLAGVDLVAGRGLTVITGPSGCGKTTLLEVIAGIRRPDRGEVSAPEVHLVTQRPFLGAGTLRANLTIAGPAESTDVWQALREVGLHEAIATLPLGVDSPLGDDGFGLSAGQRARLVLARALLSPSPVVLLDEPTAHVDPESAATIGDTITRLAATRTVIAVSHQPDLAARANHHVRLGQQAVTR
ncbi:ABC transporter [Janibacter sp. Soil728]|uniref:thiol reductant ABC exporter subunit CydD n=1 Tax=Janibacter sp. Soil728 TaxID=1736393 RepID=UPI0006F22678|nr:thiol reductant ABC exporter subunit CydD [Janibacter sp. Soil728]KRE39453.1 ABC transporter [Janibacter sp. Soil728]